MSVLGIDVGTTSVKVTAVGSSGEIIANASSAYLTRRPAPDRAELDPQELIEATKQCLRSVCQSLEPGELTSLSISALGEAFLPVGRDHCPVGPLLLAMDFRGSDVYANFVVNFGKDRLEGITGHPIHPQFTLSKVLWWLGAQQASDSDLLGFFDAHAFLCHALVGCYVTDHSLASRTQYYDITNGFWSREILDAAGIDPSFLPEIVDTGTIIGTPTNETADLFGLPRGISVVAGGFDQACAAVGCGAVDPGIPVENIGTTMCVSAAVPSNQLDLTLISRGYHYTSHVLPDLLLLNGGSQAGAKILEWLDHIMGGDSSESIAKRLHRISESPSPVTLLPYFAGAGTPLPDSRKKAALLGMTFATSQEDLFTAGVDAINYEARLIIEHSESIIESTNYIIVSGSPARSAAWLARMADCYGRTVVRSKIHDSSAYGAAMIAAAASGQFEGLKSCAVNWLHDQEVFQPNPERREQFNAAFENYVRLRSNDC